MDRTPIKIPGKNRRDQSKAALAARKALNRPRGRPLKMLSTEIPRAPAPPVEPADIPKKRSLKNIKSRRKMTKLEKLPTELLADIFLYSLNIDLPRSSPVIGAKLTSELIYTRVIIEAFGPTWDKGYGKYMPRNLETHDDEYPLSGFPPGLDLQLRGIGDAKLQSAILRCRWASLSVLQKSQEIWVEMHAKAREFRPLPSVINLDLEVERQLQQERFERHTTPAGFFEEDFVAFSHYVQGYSEAKEETSSWTTYVDVASDVEIPQSLLLGPWTEEMTRHLYWLVKGGAQFNWLTSTSGEAAMMGLRTAVVEGDLRVIHLLCWAGLKERVDVETVIWVIQNAVKDKIKVAVVIMSMWLEAHDMDARERSLIDTAVAEIKDKAIAESNDETIAYVDALHGWFGLLL